MPVNDGLENDPTLEFLVHATGCSPAEECLCDFEGRDLAIDHYQKMLEERDRLLRMARQYWTIINNPDQEQCVNCMSKASFDHYHEVLDERDRLREALAFFRSTILSGEPWTERCEQIYQNATAVNATVRRVNNE